MKMHLKVQISPDTLEVLEREAKATGLTFSELADRILFSGCEEQAMRREKSKEFREHGARQTRRARRERTSIVKSGPPDLGGLLQG